MGGGGNTNIRKDLKEITPQGKEVWRAGDLLETKGRVGKGEVEG